MKSNPENENIFFFNLNLEDFLRLNKSGGFPLDLAAFL